MSTYENKGSMDFVKVCVDPQRDGNYISDGTNDGATINQALTDLANDRGGILVLSAQQFQPEVGIVIPESSIRIQGQGGYGSGTGDNEGTKLHFDTIPAPIDVAIDANWDRVGNYDMDVGIRDLVLHGGQNIRDALIAACNCQVDFQNLVIDGAGPASYINGENNCHFGIMLGQSNMPSSVTNINTKYVQVGIGTRRDHLRIEGFTHNYGRYAIANGANTYLNNLYYTPLNTTMTDVSGTPYNTYINNIHSYDKYEADFVDTCAVICQNSGRNVYDHIHIETPHQYGFIQMGGDASIFRLTGGGGAITKAITMAFGAAIDYDHRRILSLKVFDDTTQGVDTALDITATPDLWMKARVAIPAATVIANGVNTWNCTSKYSYDDHTVWRVTPITMPENHFEYYAYDADIAAVDRVVIEIINRTGGAHVLSAEQEIFVERVPG